MGISLRTVRHFILDRLIVERLIAQFSCTTLQPSLSERRHMTDYGKTLKQLIDFSGVKMYLVAEAVGYDVSYISKWCNKGYLPSAKASPKINEILSRLFSEEISSHGDLDLFRRQFGITGAEKELDTTIRVILQTAYDNSSNRENSKTARQDNTSMSVPRAIVHTNEIRRFFRQDFSEYLLASPPEPGKPLIILCTIDLCLFLGKILPEIIFPGDMELLVRIAVNEERLYQDHMAFLPRLYYFMSLHSKISFEIFSDEKLSDANVILIQDRMAAICSLDNEGHALSIFCSTDSEAVHHMQGKLIPFFNRSRILIQASDPINFHRKGYRTDFYAKNNYQILLACGFEYLLPRDCWESVVETARKKYKNEHIALLVRRLQVTWEEIFEHGSIDFFIMKTALIRYIETGEIIFTDVVHRLSPEQRKSHIQNVLEVSQKNPNIVFYLIDDEKLPVKNRLAYLSVFNNRKKAFMKNPNRYHCDSGPFFYSINDSSMIHNMTAFFDELKTKPVCLRFGYKDLLSFYTKYSSLINRMIDL